MDIFCAVFFEQQFLGVWNIINYIGHTLYGPFIQKNVYKQNLYAILGSLQILLRIIDKNSCCRKKDLRPSCKDRDFGPI